ncbi:MAG: hypothetical protein R3C05_07480 [Pirellulaceae bacterium]
MFHNGSEQMEQLRPMREADIPDVLQILHDRDEDDAEDAAETFRRGLLGYFVWVRGNDIVGVTGATPIDNTVGGFVLGWTCIRNDQSPESLRQMISQMLSMLRDEGGRKIFAPLSD